MYTAARDHSFIQEHLKFIELKNYFVMKLFASVDMPFLTILRILLIALITLLGNVHIYVNTEFLTLTPNS